MLPDDSVQRLPVNNSTTVASTILQVEGAAAKAAKGPVWLARPRRDRSENASQFETQQIDWQAIVQRGSVEANLHLLPGDRIYIGHRPPQRGGSGSGGSIKFQAGENVIAEGATFLARCARLSYSQDKDQMILEGDGQSDAELYKQEREGGAVQSFKGAEDHLLQEDRAGEGRRIPFAGDEPAARKAGAGWTPVDAIFISGFVDAVRIITANGCRPLRLCALPPDRASDGQDTRSYGYYAPSSSTDNSRRQAAVPLPVDKSGPHR